MVKNKNGITLVALVITIIVLLIMAGVSIALVVGDNGILSKSQEAKAGSIVAEETEQVNLAYSSALTKNLGDAVTAENLQNELDLSVGANKTTVTVDGNSLKVLFNETGHSYNINNGRVLEGTNGTTSLTDLEKLQIYFGKGPEEWAGQENHTFKNIEPIPDASTSITVIREVYRGFIIKYNNNYYLINIIDKEYPARYEVSLLSLGVYNIGGENVLITPSTPDNLMHLNFMELNTNDFDSNMHMYYYKDNGEDIDLNRTFNGNVYFTWEYDDKGTKNRIVYYDENTGDVLPIVDVRPFNSAYYLDDNGEIDETRPYTGEVYEAQNGDCFDASGIHINVKVMRQ